MRRAKRADQLVIIIFGNYIGNINTDIAKVIVVIYVKGDFEPKPGHTARNRPANIQNICFAIQMFVYYREYVLRKTKGILIN